MQQVALPSLHDPHRPRFRAVLTPPFPLVRPVRRPSAAAAAGPTRPRRFVAGLLFGVLMSLTLLLLGYEARVYSDANPDLLRSALDAARSLGR
jgi:hypothetical protein